MDYKIVLQLLLAAFCGFLFGAEREKSNKDAGVRTNMLVCLAACTLVIISKRGFLNAEADISRVAASVIPGIGFLGAGSIFMRGNRVFGLTSASLILITTSVGMAIGAELYQLAIACTAIVCVIMYGTRYVDGKRRKRLREETWADLSVDNKTQNQENEQQK